MFLALGALVAAGSVFWATARGRKRSSSSERYRWDLTTGQRIAVVIGFVVVIGAFSLVMVLAARSVS